jgi:putative ABC transport system permease protein
MMFLRIAGHDASRRKGSMLVVFAFILLSSLLVSVGVSLIVELNGALDRLFLAAKVPHFVQMHTGAVDEQRIHRWAMETGMVEETQVSRMISLDGRSLTFSSSEMSEEESVMDISLVSQNSDFDFLLDRTDRIVRPGSGEIGVPVYYAERRNVEIGDTVELSGDGFSRSFTVSALIQDAQMNPAIVHSKRFLVSEGDYGELMNHFPESEYLIEFRLSDPDMVGDFAEAYQTADLPDRGPAVDFRLFRMLNALSDGMVAAVVVMLSLLLMVIALLCLRFTILAAMEEDYREIGIMKAVGMGRRDIRRVSLVKYAVLSLLAGLSGYILSLPANRLLMKDFRYESDFSSIPLLAICFVILIIMMSARIILGRFDCIGAVEALNAGNRTEAPTGAGRLSISRNRRLNLNIFLGFRDVLQRFRLFGLLLFVFFFSAFITVMPMHFLSTLKSPDFISYMGIGRSDIRIDLRQSEGIENRFDDMVSRIAADRDVARFSPFLTSRLTLVESDGRPRILSSKPAISRSFHWTTCMAGHPQEATR